MAAWESVRAWCEINGDKTRLPWGQMLGHLRQSLRNGVTKLVTQYNECERPTAEENHERWCIDKIQEGWQVGDQYSAANKTHPNLRPYDELPHYQQIKDTIFIDTVYSLTNALSAVNARARARESEQSQPVPAMPPPNEAAPENQSPAEPTIETPPE